MTTPIVALDTETTGLHPTDDDIWEFAGIRREPDGAESELHLFIQHDRAKCVKLPPSFRADHRSRWPGDGRAASQWSAAMQIDKFLRPGRPHLIGAVPDFDTTRLGHLLAKHQVEWTAPWHYHLVDVENLAVGYLRAKHPRTPRHPPWDSDELSELLGVKVDQQARHTAMGDARWALRIYDKVMGVKQ